MARVAVPGPGAQSLLKCRGCCEGPEPTSYYPESERSKNLSMLLTLEFAGWGRGRRGAAPGQEMPSCTRYDAVPTAPGHDQVRIRG